MSNDYDEKYQYISAQTVNMNSASLNAYQLYSLPQLTASQDGYVQVFIANEGDKNVWFDNLKITYTEHGGTGKSLFAFRIELVGIEKQGYPDNKLQCICSGVSYCLHRIIQVICHVQCTKFLMDAIFVIQFLFIKKPIIKKIRAWILHTLFAIHFDCLMPDASITF